MRQQFVQLLIKHAATATQPLLQLYKKWSRTISTLKPHAFSNHTHLRVVWVSIMCGFQGAFDSNKSKVDDYIDLLRVHYMAPVRSTSQPSFWKEAVSSSSLRNAPSQEGRSSKSKASIWEHTDIMPASLFPLLFLLLKKVQNEGRRTLCTNKPHVFVFCLSVDNVRLPGASAV